MIRSFVNKDKLQGKGAPKKKGKRKKNKILKGKLTTREYGPVGCCNSTANIFLSDNERIQLTDC